MHWEDDGRFVIDLPQDLSPGAYTIALAIFLDGNSLLPSARLLRCASASGARRARKDVLMQGSVRAKSTASPKACARPTRSPDRHGPKGRGAIFEHREAAPPAAVLKRGRVEARARPLPARPDHRSLSCQGNRR